jgi:hypothetical protein
MLSKLPSLLRALQAGQSSLRLGNDVRRVRLIEEQNHILDLFEARDPCLVLHLALLVAPSSWCAKSATQRDAAEQNLLLLLDNTSGNPLDKGGVLRADSTGRRYQQPARQPAWALMRTLIVTADRFCSSTSRKWWKET